MLPSAKAQAAAQTQFTGTSVNPARSFGPALIAGNLDGIWVFLLAPLVGGALAAVVYSFLSSDK